MRNRLMVLVCTAMVPASLAAQDTVTPTIASVRTRSGTTLTLSGLLQADARFISGSGSTSGPILRRAELIFETAGPRGFGLRLQPDFGQGRVQLQDAFVRWHGPGADSVIARFGRFRPAFGIERIRSSGTLLFPERGLINAYMPGRATGLDVRVTLRRTAVQLGMFQPPASTSAQVVDTDGDLERTPAPRRESLLRVEWLACRCTAGGVRVHLGALAGRASGGGEAATQPARILTIGQQPVFAFRTNGADRVIADGDRWRGEAGVQSVGARVAWHIDVVAVEDGIRQGDVERRAVKHDGFGAAWSMVHGGHRAPNYVISPTAPRGAVEWGLRVGVVRVQRDAVASLGEPGSAAGARSAGLGVSWLPSPVTRLAASYDCTKLDLAGRHVEHALIVRVQQAF